MLDPTSIRHETLDAVHIGIEQTLVFRVCLPHHSVTGVDRDVMDRVDRSFVRVEKEIAGLQLT